ncbi:phage antirepressor KilAC domain-containing protein [Lactococcus lactis]|uniref:phage antirepressor KilAC domain-containing protein n=1 Tax=Lactococcus lactis TaxID=1358 RepID=UPI00265B215D|nr:phage antirepressor KilAC domain-containing protein [Lactococcus lactis]WKF73054.1 phage antirepressor KilAC domain-containing protein [Lactococcus lactis]
MNELQNFTNGIFNLDVKVEGEEVLFSAEQVAKSLGLTQKQNKSGKIYESIRWETINKYLPQLSGEIEKGSFISEPMVYKLAFKANNAVSEKFTDWLAVEVLPTIRKHGAYMTDAKLEEVLLNPDTLISLATQLKEERQARLGLEKENSQLNLELDEANKKLPFLEWALQTKGLVTPTIIAKKYGKTAVWLNDWLHKQGVQFKQGKCWVLYKKYDDKGYSDTIFSPTDIDHLHPSMKWTVKGMKFIYELLKDNGYLPISERDEDDKAS